jgi:hypothetical protein
LATATGVTEVPQPRAEVWRALAVLEPYCAVCDVSYVVRGKGKGTTFVCVPGRLDGAGPPEGAPQGEIVEWRPGRLVATRLELPGETWTTRIELADADAGGTTVTLTVDHVSAERSRVLRAVQSRAQRQLVRQTVDGELAKVPDHIAQVAGRR